MGIMNRLLGKKGEGEGKVAVGQTIANKQQSIVEKIKNLSIKKSVANKTRSELVKKFVKKEAIPKRKVISTYPNKYVNEISFQQSQNNKSQAMRDYGERPEDYHLRMEAIKMQEINRQRQFADKHDLLKTKLVVNENVKTLPDNLPQGTMSFNALGIRKQPDPKNSLFKW